MTYYTGIFVGLFLFVGLSSMLSGQEFQTWPTSEGGNGHEYAVIPGKWTWQSASRRATNLGGYLATVTSKEENDFILAVSDNPDLWNSSPTRTVGPWLGGFQESDAREPDRDWQWVTGEPFNFAPWAIEQPDDFRGVEDYVQYVTVKGHPEGTWNDIRNEGGVSTPSISYAVEREPPQRLSGTTQLRLQGITLSGFGGTGEDVNVTLDETVTCEADWVLRTPNIAQASIRRDVFSLECDTLQASFLIGDSQTSLQLSSIATSLINVRSERTGKTEVPNSFEFVLASESAGSIAITGDAPFALDESGMMLESPITLASEDSTVQITANFAFNDGWDEVIELLPGDTNGDGTVAFNDFLTLSANFSNTGPNVTWQDGDFNNDQQVTFSDFLSLSQNFGSVAATQQQIQNVPEPTCRSAVLWGLCFYALLNRRLTRAAS